MSESQNNGGMAYTATDLTNFVACRHLTTLGRKPGERDRSLIAELGDAHEHRYLRQLEAEGLKVLDLEPPPPAGTSDAGPKKRLNLTAEVDRTLEAMRSGAPVIFQAWVGDDTSFGRTDFLQRVETPSDLGDWSYEVADTKLARSPKPSALLQLLFYTRHVTALQGTRPEQMHVILGDGRIEPFTVAHYVDYGDAITEAYEAFKAEPTETYPWPVPHCQVCPWSDDCSQRRIDDDHLSTVAWLTRRQGQLLNAEGVATVADLAANPARPTRIGEDAFERIQRQADLQNRARLDGEHHVHVLEPAFDPDEPAAAKNLGLLLIPPADEGDLFFDIEGYPHGDDGSLEYLWGFADRSGDFTAFWGLDAAEERTAFEESVDFITERRRTHPNMHVYHYAPYERTAFGRLMGRHGSREYEVDTIFRQNVLVDLYASVRTGVAVSQPSYSIKYLEPLYGFDREEEDLKRGDDSIVMFHDAAIAPDVVDQELLQIIENYNRDDCLSTLDLEQWLRGLRTQLVAEVGELDLSTQPEAIKEPTPEEQTRAELAGRLLYGVPEAEAERSPEQQARYLLAHSLEFHRRESKPEWWAYFTRKSLFDAEGPEALVEDSETLSSLTHLDSTPGPNGNSAWTHRFEFDIDQLHKFKAGDSAEGLGHPLVNDKPIPGLTVFDVDQRNGIIEVKGGKLELSLVSALIPKPSVRDTALVSAIQQVAADVADNGIDPTNPAAAEQALLLRAIPRTSYRTRGESLVVDPNDGLTDLVETIAGLDNSFLAVQGPPGTGKTWSSSQAIVELVRRGFKVGVTANSHKVIGNLLDGICDAAGDPELGPALTDDQLSIAQKAKPEQASNASRVEARSSNYDPMIEDPSVVAAGTAWLFAGYEKAFDVVFVDEAGQFSLANALAIARSAKRVVFVGDPQQLTSPLKGTHPPGVAVSALDHMLDGANTIAPDAGVLLSQTRRMHPAISEWSSEQFYDGRLEAHPITHDQRISGGDWLAQPGIHFVPVEHDGNTVRSREEALVVAELVDELLTRDWTNEKGETARITLDDILIVVPYNAHLNEVSSRLSDQARVGTVDRFQGQEAAVVIYSMAASDTTGGRGAAFLFSPNRLNVALTRARVLSIVVGVPSLRVSPVSSPNQMRDLSAFCSATRHVN